MYVFHQIWENSSHSFLKCFKIFFSLFFVLFWTSITCMLTSIFFLFFFFLDWIILIFVKQIHWVFYLLPTKVTLKNIANIVTFSLTFFLSL